MSYFSIINLVTGFIVVILLAGMIFLRVRIGKTRANNPMHHAARRNSIVAAFIILIFLMYWIHMFLSGRLIEEGIVGWKAVAAVIAIVMGALSIILLIVGTFRRK